MEAQTSPTNINNHATTPQGAVLATSQDLAKRYGLSRRFIEQRGQAGILPRIKFGHRCVRYPVAECDRIMLAGKEEAK